MVDAPMHQGQNVQKLFGLDYSKTDQKAAFQSCVSNQAGSYIFPKESDKNLVF